MTALYFYKEQRTHYFFFGVEGFWVQPKWANFLSPLATMLASRLGCSTAALTTPQKVSYSWDMVELKMFDFSDRTRTAISILTSAADLDPILLSRILSKRISKKKRYALKRLRLLSFISPITLLFKNIKKGQFWTVFEQVPESINCE